MATVNKALKTFNNAGKKPSKFVEKIAKAPVKKDAELLTLEQSVFDKLFSSIQEKFTKPEMKTPVKEATAITVNAKESKKKSKLDPFKKIMAVNKIGGLADNVLSSGMNFKQLEDQFVARTGDAEIGSGMFDKFRQDAINAGQDVNKSLQKSLSFIGITKDVGNLSQINDLMHRTVSFDPSGQSLDNAEKMIKSALQGDLSMLQLQFGFDSNDIEKLNLENLAKTGDIEGVIKGLHELYEMRGMGQEAYDELLQSPINQLNSLKSNFHDAFSEASAGAVTALQPLLVMLNEAFQAGEFEFFFNALNNGFTLLADIVTWVAELIRNNMDIVKNILIAVGIVALIAGAMFLFSWLQAIWPLLLIIGIITLVIGILNSLGISTEQVIGFIVGLFMGLVSAVWNAIAILWNAIISFGEFLVNAFIDPVYAIRKLFYDLSMFFYRLLGDMINIAIKGLNGLTSVVNSIFGSKIPEIKQFNITEFLGLDNIPEPTSNKNVVDNSSFKMKLKNIDANVNKGYDFGSTLFDNKLDKGIADPNKMAEDWSRGSSSAITAPSVDKCSNSPSHNNIDQVNKVNQVGEVKEAVDISSEDLKMMRELAEMKNLQNFVTLTPQITFGDTHVRNESDMDTIFNRITTQLNEDIAISAKAVYR